MEEAAPNPDFTLTMDVLKEKYDTKISLLREDVIAKFCENRKLGLPVLPQEEKVPKKWFHVVLKAKDTITLAIRADNLYLVGFQTPAKVWWEFGKNGDTHLLGSGARWLGFGGAYSDLIGHQKGLETVALGRAEMATAVNVLASYKHDAETAMVAAGGDQQELDGDGDPYALPKSKLVKLVIMICEGLRFKTILKTVADDFDKVGVAKINKIQGQQVNKWDKISKAVLTWAVDPNAKFPDLEKVEVKDKNDAVGIVALVKG